MPAWATEAKAGYREGRGFSGELTGVRRGGEIVR